MLKYHVKIRAWHGAFLGERLISHVILSGQAECVNDLWVQLQYDLHYVVAEAVEHEHVKVRRLAHV